MNWDKKFTSFIGSKRSVVLHTVVFSGAFSLPFFGVDLDTVLLFLTTIVSLEAIYLAIFIQISVNQNTESLEDVEEGIEEISEDIEEIAEDVDEIEKDSDDMVKVEKQESIDLENIQSTLKKLLEEVERLKK